MACLAGGPTLPERPARELGSDQARLGPGVRAGATGAVPADHAALQGDPTDLTGYEPAGTKTLYRTHWQGLEHRTGLAFRVERP